jgi:hypothetical protein
VRELVELAGGRADLLTRQVPIWPRSADDPLPARGPAAAAAAAQLLDAAAREAGRAKPGALRGRWTTGRAVRTRGCSRGR